MSESYFPGCFHQGKSLMVAQETAGPVSSKDRETGLAYMAYSTIMLTPDR